MGFVFVEIIHIRQRNIKYDYSCRTYLSSKQLLVYNNEEINFFVSSGKIVINFPCMQVKPNL